MKAITVRKHIARTILSRPTIWFGAILAGCLGHSLQPALATPGSWTRKANMPMTFGVGAACAVEETLYVVGGDSGTNLQSVAQLRTLYAYDPTDPVQDKSSSKRKMTVPCLAAAAATIDGKIYHTGGASGDPGNFPNAVYYDSLWVFDPQGGVAPQISGLTIERPDRVRLAWQGEAGRLYGVESKLNLAAGRWTRVNFSTGTNSILATNEVVEATCTVLPADTKRFFRVVEAN